MPSVDSVLLYFIAVVAVLVLAVTRRRLRAMPKKPNAPRFGRPKLPCEVCGETTKYRFEGEPMCGSCKDDLLP